MDINIDSQIVVKTAAEWAADTAIPAAKTILITSDALYTGTNVRKIKIPNGVDLWSALDYLPIDIISIPFSDITGDALDNVNLASYIDNIDNTSDADKPISTATQTALNAKEGTITATTSADYYRGDKTFQTLDTLAVPEHTNLYFTSGRAIGSTLTGYVSGAGVISAADSILSAIQKLNGNIAGLPAYTFSTGLTNTANTITNNLSTGIAGGQSINGGTGASEILTISSTTSVTKGRIQIGSTDLINIGNSTSLNQRLLRIGQDTAIIDIGSLVGTTTQGALYLTKATPSATNYSLSSDSSGNTYVNAENGFTIQLRTNNVTRADIGGTFMNFTSGAASTAALVPYTFTTPASTNQTASTETIGFRVNMSASIQHATGAITTQRDFLIQARTHRFVGSSTLTEGSTFAITGAIQSGANGTITNANAITVEAGNVIGVGGLAVTNSYGITINAQTGATNNYAARFLEGNVGFATSVPNSTIHNNGSMAFAYVAKTANYTLTSSDYLVDVTSGTNTQTLPTAVGIAGRVYIVKNSGTGVVTIATTSSQTIDGILTKTLGTRYSGYAFMSNNSNWIIIGTF